MNAPTLVHLIEPPSYLASVVLLVWASLPRANPLVVTFRPIARTFTRRNYFLFVAAGFGVVGLNALLTALDDHFTAWVISWRGEDFTRLIWSVEGDAVRWFQALRWKPLTWYLGWAYVVGFAVVLPWTLIVLDWLGRRRACRGVLFALALNYAMVQPFYVFFPVRECHAFQVDGRPPVSLGLDELHPAIMEVLRPMSGLDNCFPSFHTSLAVTCLLAAWATGRRAFRAAMTVMMVSILFSTLYLGIHWITDVVAGGLVGAVAYALGRRLATRGRGGPAAVDTTAPV